MADKGFPQIIEKAEKRGAFCVLPPFCRGNYQLSDSQNREGYKCSRLRIHVERVIGRMKLLLGRNDFSQKRLVVASSKSLNLKN